MGWFGFTAWERSRLVDKVILDGRVFDCLRESPTHTDKQACLPPAGKQQAVSVAPGAQQTTCMLRNGKQNAVSVAPNSVRAGPACLPLDGDLPFGEHLPRYLLATSIPKLLPCVSIELLARSRTRKAGMACPTPQQTSLLAACWQAASGVRGTRGCDSHEIESSPTTGPISGWVPFMKSEDHQ
jgi:hypothetical protein